MSVVELCGLFGRTKQAYYKSLGKIPGKLLKETMILSLVEKYRYHMPRIGVRKLHYLINRDLAGQMYIGRDALFGLLSREGYLLRRHPKRVRTTYSYHRLHTYENLIENFIPSKAHELYVSDITYIRLSGGRFLYLSLVTDVYSHKIVGWALSETLETRGGPLEALEIALKELPPDHHLIHHSDRGIQYCSNSYTSLLKSRHIRISMTQRGDPRENAVAERVNGILKMEWLQDMKLDNLQEAKRQIQQIIHTYNTLRPHSSNQMYVPEVAHRMVGPLKRCWKNYYPTRPPLNQGG